jgi:hypothetical protein
VLGSKKIMVGLVAALLSTAACSTDPDIKPDGPIVGSFETSDITEFPLWRSCSDKLSNTTSPSLADFIKFNPIIFTGKAVERRLTLNEVFHFNFNGCWVDFKVKEKIHGKVEDNVWVKFIYNERTDNHEYFSYKHCDIQPGKDYLITGRYIPSGEPISDGTMKDVPGWIGYVLANKDVWKNPRYICSPVEKLPEGNNIVTEIKKILGE